MIKINKLKGITRYHLEAALFQTVIMIAVLALNILIALVIHWAVGGDASGGSTDLIVYIWALVQGLYMFGIGFKLSIENGASRKTYFISILISFAITAFAWSLVSLLVTWIASGLSTFNLFLVMYGKISFGAVLWMFSLIFFILMLGLLIRGVLRRCSRKVQMIILFSAIVLGLALVLGNSFSGGIVFAEIGKFLLSVLGFNFHPASPYIGAAFFAVLTVIECVAFYLLIRKAETIK